MGLFRRLPMILALLILVPVAGCGGSASGAADPSPTGTLVIAEETTAAPQADSPLECPVTIPQVGFAPPAPYPAEYPHEGLAWYGTKDLWTALDVEGNHTPRKSVWWSVNFLGGPEEEQPEVWVTWRRLDAGEPVVIDNQGKATNAFTAEENWFMIAGIDPREPGCWQVEASYKGVALSYVYQRP